MEERSLGDFMSWEGGVSNYVSYAGVGWTYLLGGRRASFLCCVCDFDLPERFAAEWESTALVFGIMID